ncbi:MAG TPA: exodeoxyribonuclease I [Xanthomonadales bacterium]|nr:exodeoxyribonuclease I [Xanthomonadales bacterium]
MKLPDTFLWHDYETFGANPVTDRPAQFAAQRTDAELNPVGDPLTLYCAPADDVLPHPAACLITGITPQQALARGTRETGFAQRVLEEMSQPGTCSAGYNSIRFDDVITRNLLYRNLRDPYEREYRNGNSRWDLIDLARMCYALRPEGMEWPLHEPGKPSFRLEDLSAANGIHHEGAHDALADVRATIDLARRIRAAQPRLFRWALDLRNQKQAAALLDTVEPKPLLHTSSRIAATRGCTTLVLPLAVPADRPKAVIAFDLEADPSPLIDEPADVLRERVFTAAEDLPEEVERLPLKLIHSNHVPMVAPLATLKGVDTRRIQLDPEKCLQHAATVLRHLEPIRAKVSEVFTWQPEPSADRSDPDLMLYSGDFFSASDRHLMNKILTGPPGELGRHLWSFQDQRLPVMLFRYRARNYPETLSVEERRAWDEDRRARLVAAAGSAWFTLGAFREAVRDLREEKMDEPGALEILDQLEAWVDETGISRL